MIVASSHRNQYQFMNENKGNMDHFLLDIREYSASKDIIKHIQYFLTFETITKPGTNLSMTLPPSVHRINLLLLHRVLL